MSIISSAVLDATVMKKCPIRVGNTGSLFQLLGPKIARPGKVNMFKHHNNIETWLEHRTRMIAEGWLNPPSKSDRLIYEARSRMNFDRC